MRRDWVRMATIWAILTLVLEVLVFTWSMLPEGYAREADIADEAYVILLAFAAPVFAFVMAMLITSAWRHRVKPEGPPTEDGPPVETNKRVLTIWLTVTSLLALTILVFPGFTGLAALGEDNSADLVVEVRAARWFWDITYPNGGTTSDELVVPVDKRVRFDVTSTDILHSFWVPAFRSKIDAVPGRTTELYVTPERTGSMETDSNLRVQCAELCGVGHADMAIPVRVVEGPEFEAWMKQLTPPAAAKEGT